MMSPTSPENRTLYLGASGWAHRDWVGKLYPHDMPPGEYLTAYADHFDTVEIEHTFFEIPLKEMVRSWYRRTPDEFLFCPCMPRQITHVQRLRNFKGLLEDFLSVNEAVKLGMDRKKIQAGSVTCVQRFGGRSICISTIMCSS
jgi:uncharacterized protein YecE (DUF72 family)